MVQLYQPGQTPQTPVLCPRTLNDYLGLWENVRTRKGAVGRNIELKVQKKDAGLTNVDGGHGEGRLVDSDGHRGWFTVD